MTDLKEEAKQIFLCALRDLDIEKVIREKIKVKGDLLELNDENINLADCSEVVIIGFGKASLIMGSVIERLLGPRINRGILVSDHRHNVEVKSEVIIAGHPLPDSNSLKAGEKILRAIRTCSSKALVIFLISGGGSSLVEFPVSSDLGLEDIRSLNSTLVNSGAAIREINIVRKHLSQIKGGRLGYEARNLRCIALYLSDVNPGDLHSLASNPLLPDDASVEEFFAIIDEYRLIDKLPPGVSETIKQERISCLPAGWSNRQLTALLLLDNLDAIKAASEVARRRGFRVEADLEHFEGEYKDVADRLIDRLLYLRSFHAGDSVCLVSGGEVSCPVSGDGRGGRNQEFVLYSAARLAALGVRDVAVLSCGTDGIDGNSNAAGAVADAETINNSRKQNLNYLDYLKRNDSYSFFKKLGGLVLTGPTGNNVRDLRVLLARGH
ncbi:MAG: DUF4147 domain-containing protein [Blastocatellia bacterium]|nr:DUF4147 domain-containing protein [Blastocatellia bacterium]